jgi:hypothetical protein
MHKPANLFSSLASWGFATCVVLATALTPPSRADDFVDTLHAGTTVYSNVTVFSKTSADIFFKHSYGFGNAKVRDLDRKTLLKLGYELAPDPNETPSVLNQSAQTVMESAMVTNLVNNPQVQHAQQIIDEKLPELIELLTPQFINGLVAGIIGVYLFFCFCCRQICVKVGQKGSPLIWIPVLQAFPLLRAAGIPRWWFFASFIPPIGLIVSVWWSFKIAAARSKSWVVGLLLLLPVTNLLAFLYLAFSGVGRSDSDNSNVISLGGPPKRAAA